MPWLAEGGICSVLCATESEYPFIEAAIEREAYAAQAGSGNLRISRVASGSSLESPLAACLTAFDIDPSMPKLRVAEALAQVLRSEPTLFIVRLCGSASVAWWEILSDFADIYRKRYPASPLTIIIMGTAPVASIRPQFDFRQGWPEGIDLWNEGLEVRNRWAGYRYLRIAWEAAGSLSIAEDLEQRIWDLTLGDDDSLEKHFNDHAQERITTANYPLPQWADLITAYGHRHSLSQSEDLFKQPALWWTPPHSIGSRLAPWVCRAALLQNNATCGGYWKLRNELICEPLVRELVMLCQQAEALIRVRVLRSCSNPPPPEAAHQLLERFRLGGSGSTEYPFNHPAPPVDAWAFASLGEVINATNEHLPKAFWDLLLLRNHIGHGHHAGWKQICALIDFMRVIQ